MIFHVVQSVLMFQYNCSEVFNTVANFTDKHQFASSTGNSTLKLKVKRKALLRGHSCIPTAVLHLMSSMTPEAVYLKSGHLAVTICMAILFPILFSD